MRVDGVLTEATTVPKRMVGGVVSRIKIMSDLDISERRIPQDGRVGLTVEGRHVDVRVVTIPSVHGEGVVLRILDKEGMSFALDKLGHAGSGAGALPHRLPPPARSGSHDRPDGIGQVDLAVRRAAPSSTPPRRTSSRSRTPSSIRCPGSRRCRSTPRPA